MTTKDQPTQSPQPANKNDDGCRKKLPICLKSFGLEKFNQTFFFLNALDSLQVYCEAKCTTISPMLPHIKMFLKPVQV